MALILRRNKRFTFLILCVLIMSCAFIMAGCDKEVEETAEIEEPENKEQENVITIVDDSSNVFTDSDKRVNGQAITLDRNDGGNGEGGSSALSALSGFGGEDGLEIADGSDPDTSLIASVEYGDKSEVPLNMSWQYADYSKINSGSAVFYKAGGNRKDFVVGVNAGHGTKGGTSVKTYCHPDKSPKVTGGTTAAGSVEAVAVSGGMSFNDGASEASVNLKMARALRDELLARGYDVLMVRDGDDVQLDNVARTVICNNVADCHIAIHWDGDGLDYDKGCFYISVPDGIKQMEPVSSYWQEHERLGRSLIDGLKRGGFKINGDGSVKIDLTQTSYSTIPSVDIELGNQSGDHSDGYIKSLSLSLADGVDNFVSN